MEKKRNYWGYRICNKSADYFCKELNEGRLRQGWGYDSGQDLRSLTVDKGASYNLKMYNDVKKGDILLIPRIPSWEEISIAEATEDWSDGYRYDIPEEQGDFGHIFPARFIMSFNRYSPNVKDNIRSSFHCLRRFWSMNAYAEDIEKIMDNTEQVNNDCLITSYDNTPNLFDYATSELSQDAFILWLLNWANIEYKKYDEELNLTAQRFVKMLLGQEHDISVTSVKTYKQQNNIDVFAIINEKFALIIEDKVNTGTHDDQLKRYKEWISNHNEYKNLALECVYLKTGNESLSYLKKIEHEEKYNLVLRKDVLGIIKTCNSKNSIIIDFYQHLTEIENDTNSFKQLSYDKWTWNAWQGFYMELEQKLNLNLETDKWFYVSNKRGGFLGFSWHWKPLSNCKVYLQFEQGPLCIKIEPYNDENRAAIRNHWSDVVISKFQKKGLLFVKRPDRFGN
ncbi:MAG: PD-(D/E)XK nuclease family protein, partial [Prevotella sp.]|nr:PD-(D/E)XK nuclease family protein [Prevotella sp.]